MKQVKTGDKIYEIVSKLLLSADNVCPKFIKDNLNLHIVLVNYLQKTNK